MVDKISFYPLDIDYKEGVRLFGRTENGRSIVAIDTNLEPYFYIIPENESNIKKFIQRLENLDIIGEDKHYKVTQVKLVKKNYFGKPIEVIKVTFNVSQAISYMKEAIRVMPETKEIKEHDISYSKKYLIENKITPLTLCEVKGEIKDNKDYNADIYIWGKVKPLSPDTYDNPKILAFDIEAYGTTFGEDQPEKDPIIMISFYGSDGFKKVITWKTTKNLPDYVEVVDSELELLEAFNKLIKQQNPDYLIGYNSDGFDLPYINTRAKKYKVKLDFGYDKAGIAFSNRGSTQGAKIKGIIHLDIFKFIRRVMSGSLQLDSYSLDMVSQELLGERKIDLTAKEMVRLWDKGEIKEICEYNLHDSNLALKLTQKILPNLNELVKITGIPIYEVCRSSYGNLVENYLMKKAKELNEIIPSKPTNNEIGLRKYRTYQGAFVMQPTPGIYDDIVILDFMSLYPTLIASKNICPSTLNYEEGLKTPEITEESGRKVNYYFRKKEGFIPTAIKDIILTRKRVKDIIEKEKSHPVLEARSYALKTVGNATYGYLAFFGARWYSLECAASITAWAREYIQNVMEKAKKNKFHVIYGDTDSLVLSYEGQTEKKVLDFLDSINKDLPDLMELELEDFYQRGIFVAKKGEVQSGAKKKYALINKKGEIKIVGFETVRRDWSYISRKTQSKVLEMILNRKPKEEVIKYIQEVISAIRQGEIKIKDLIMQSQITRKLDQYQQIGPHVSVARKLEERGLSISPGMSVWYIIIKGKGMIRDRAKPPEDCQEGDYDIDYYINNQVIPSIERIIEVLGYTKEDLITSKDQSSLQSFIK